MLFFSSTSFIPNFFFCVHPQITETLPHDYINYRHFLGCIPALYTFYFFLAPILHSSVMPCTSPTPLSRFALLTLSPCTQSSLPILSSTFYLLLPPKPEKPVFGTFSTIVVNFFSTSPGYSSDRSLLRRLIQIQVPP